MELEALGAITGQVLDAGCGLGDNAIYLAQRGHQVTGFDSSPTGIEQARARAAAAGVQVRFEVADATELTGLDRLFDTVVDSALYHCLDSRRTARLRRRPAPRDHAARPLVHLLLLRRQCQRRHRPDGGGDTGRHPRHVGKHRVAHRLSRTRHLCMQRGGFLWQLRQAARVPSEHLPPGLADRCARWANEWPPSCRSSMTAA